GCARLRPERGGGPREVRRRPGRDRARLARSGLAGESARRGASHARRARRPCERRSCSVPRGAAPRSDRAPPPRLAGRRPPRSPPASRTAHELGVAGIAMRRLSTKAARAALARAERAAGGARIPALTAEVESASLVLNTPAARLIADGRERLLLLE